ncbi:MAG: TatD family hydrolase [Flammeovirgaceae bacterium]
MVDTHAHLYSDKLKADLDKVLENAFSEGLTKIFMPNVDSESIEAMLALEQRLPNQCFAMMGLHPCSVNQDFEKELAIVEEWLQKRKFVAVGEMGIDLYWDKTFFEQQKEAFRIQTQWAKKYDLPIVVHTRNSMAETLDLLEELHDEKLKGIVHCFSGNLDDAKRIINLGMYLGIGGVATYKNGGLERVLPNISLDSIVLETDCPYLAPVPHRGKRNEPAYIKFVAEKVATFVEKPLDEVIQKTSENAKKIFGV